MLRTPTRVLSALLAALGCGAEAPPPELPPRAIQWQRVTGGVTVDRRVIAGIVAAVEDTSLAFEVGGTVQSVEVNLGDRVQQGQVLARLDPEPFELAVRDAEATLAEARALREEARAALGRIEEAARSGAVSRQDLDSARAARNARESQLRAAEARLELASRELRRSVLRAPFRGSISARAVEPAMKLTSGQTAFEMDGEEGGLRVEVQMPETLIARVHQGDRVEVHFPSRDPRRTAEAASFEAIVTEVGSRAGAGNAFPVRADLLAPPAGVRPGMTAEVTFALPHAASGPGRLEGFMIPLAAALAEPEDRFSVFVYDPESSTVSKRSVRTGGVGADQIAVLQGLEEGDLIATAGVSFLRDGQVVTLLDDPALSGNR